MLLFDPVVQAWPLKLFCLVWETIDLSGKEVNNPSMDRILLQRNKDIFWLCFVQVKRIPSIMKKRKEENTVLCSEHTCSCLGNLIEEESRRALIKSYVQFYCFHCCCCMEELKNSSNKNLYIHPFQKFSLFKKLFYYQQISYIHNCKLLFQDIGNVVRDVKFHHNFLSKTVFC